MTRQNIRVKSSDVGLQIAFPVGPVWTVRTLVGLLPSVSKEVAVQVTKAGEGTGTLGARMASGDTQQPAGAHTH